MGIEIERKFLLKFLPHDLLTEPQYICQGYLSTDKNCTVRVRISGKKAFLTVKGITVNCSRSEFEYPISLEDARKMLDEFCGENIIEKNRYKVTFKGFVWEIDQFLGNNTGLLLAEIELTNENEVFELPDCIQKEVTHDTRYFNSNLMLNPVSGWETPPLQ